MLVFSVAFNTLFGISVPDPYETFWILGMHDQRIKDGTMYNVGHVELHPRFENHSIYDDYDMALVTVTRKIRFSPTVKPICLTSPNTDYTGRSGIVAGWYGKYFKLQFLIFFIFQGKIK